MFRTGNNVNSALPVLSGGDYSFNGGLWICLSICVYLYTYLDVCNLIFQACLSGCVLLGNLIFSQLIHN